MKNPCDEGGCGQRGMFRPVLLLYAPVVFQPGPKPLAKVPVKGSYCYACTKHLEPEDVLTDSNWRDIEDGLLLEGTVLPSRALTKLEFVKEGAQRAPGKAARRA